MWAILNFYYLKDMLVEVRNMIAISRAFHLKVLRNSYGKIYRFRSVHDAKYFLKKMGMNEFDYNFVEIDSEEIFTKEEVDELCRNANKIDVSMIDAINSQIGLPEYPKFKKLETKQLGVYRIHHKPYFKELKNCFYVEELRNSQKRYPLFKLSEIKCSPEQAYNCWVKSHIINYTERFKPKFAVDYNGLKITIRNDLRFGDLIIPLTIQDLHKITEDVYVDLNTGKIHSEYSAKFYKHADYAFWLKYPIFEGILKEIK